MWVSVAWPLINWLWRPPRYATLLTDIRSPEQRPEVLISDGIKRIRRSSRNLDNILDQRLGLEETAAQNDLCYQGSCHFESVVVDRGEERVDCASFDHSFLHPIVDLFVELSVLESCMKIDAMVRLISKRMKIILSH